MRWLPPHSLRTRLLGFLLLAVLVTALVQGTVAYRTARAEADDIFDYHMQQMAMSLRAGIPVGPEASGLPPGDDDDFDFVVQVWTTDGLRIFRSTAHSELPTRVVLGFSNVAAHGSTYRVFSMQSHSQVIQVAQDMAVRGAMARSLALRTVAPIALLAPLLMLVVWIVVSGSLAPVARVQRQLAARQADDLAEVSEAGLPEEVRPLVHELNLLFGRVRQAFDAQQNFVADAAHELRSPLAALRLQALGLQRAPDDAARELAVQRLTAGIDRATRLVEQLLVLARHQANLHTGQKPQALSLAGLARSVVSEMAGTAHASKVDVGVGEAQEGRIDGYPDALRILLRNLMDNAVNHTPPGTRVDVSVRRDDDALVLTVEDSGPGIPEDELARVLDRFYRVAGTQGRGSGLGLSIVSAIAELHGAALRLDRSPGLGGLRVKLRFPASA